jgi:methyltransferase (TIGR00027 family)
VRFVAVDFERDRLAGALLRAGHDAGAPTYWIWEGVTMYLHPDAVEATLGQVAERSSRGSRLAATYVTPQILAMAGRIPASLTRLVARTIGEPLHGVTERDELHARLVRHGARVVSDESTPDWATRYWGDDGARASRSVERLVVAEF